MDTAGWPGIARPLATPGVRRPSAWPAHGTPLLGVGPGVAGSRGHLLHETIVERKIGHQPLQSRMLLLQALQPVGSLDAQAAVFVLPPIVRRLGDAELPAGLDHRKPFAQFNLDGPQLPDNLFRRIPCSCHAPSFRQLESSLQSRPGLIGGRSHLWEFLHDLGIQLGPLLRGCRRPILTPRRAHFLLPTWRVQCIMRPTRDHTSLQPEV